ncbi:MAG: hypothetical protein ACRDYA_13385 [Egibacteraceae bacterium]
MMGLFVVILLAGLWASMLLPGMFRGHREFSGINSIHSFQRTMSMLARKCGSADSRPHGRHVLVLDDAASVARSTVHFRMRQRQRAVIAQLGTAVCATGGLAVFVGDLLWPVFGVTAAVFASYTLLVAQVRVRQTERREKVRDIRPARRTGQPNTHGSASSSVRTQRWVG